MSLGAGEEEESTWEGWEEATLSLVVRAVGPGVLAEAGPVVFFLDEDITGVDAPARPLGAPAAVGNCSIPGLRNAKSCVDEIANGPDNSDEDGRHAAGKC